MRRRVDPPSPRERSGIICNRFQSSKTHCPQGHAYTPENTKLAKSTKPGHFKRQCRKCQSEVAKRLRARDKLAKLVASGVAHQAHDRAPAAAFSEVASQPGASTPPAAADLAQLSDALASAAGEAVTAATAPAEAAAIIAPPVTMVRAPNAPRPFQQLTLRFLKYTGRLRP